MIKQFRGGTESARDKLNELVDAINALASMRGDDYIQVKHVSKGITFRLAVDRLLGMSPRYQDGSFWAKITAYVEADVTFRNRWIYSWEEVEKTSPGYGGWTTLSDGRLGDAEASTPENAGYNLLEDMNVLSGLCGNGVDTSGVDFPAGFEIQPVPIGAVVRMHPVVMSAGADKGETEYWFDGYPNGIDGTCD